MADLSRVKLGTLLCSVIRNSMINQIKCVVKQASVDGSELMRWILCLPYASFAFVSGQI